MDDLKVTLVINSCQVNFIFLYPRKHQKTSGFSGGIEKEHWPEISYTFFFFLDEVHVTIILSITIEPMITKDLQFRGRCNDNVENNQDTGLLQLIYHQKNIQNPVKHLKWSV